MSDDPFHYDQGLKDDYDGVVTEAWFGTNSQYNQGKTPPNWLVR